MPTLTRTFYFEHENERIFDRNTKPENSLKALEGWVDKVKKDQPLLFKAIEGKFVRIHVTGYASAPGAYEYNSDLSDARALYVQQRLERTFGTDSVKINRRARGERDSTEKPGVKVNERDAVYEKDRRVEIIIQSDEATRGVDAMTATWDDAQKFDYMVAEPF